METKVFVFAFLSCVLAVKSHGVATSHQSVVSGEGWRYGYGIAHGPHGIGHAVGESFPHGYGGFGAYAPAFGYGPSPHVYLPHPPPPKPLIIQVPQYILPHQNYGYLYPYGHGYYGGYYDGFEDHHHHHHH